MKRAALLVAAGLLATAGSAQAVLVVSMAYNNLAGSYNGAGTYTVSATSTSDGHADRIVGPGAGTSVFNAGTLGGGTGNVSIVLGSFGAVTTSGTFSFFSATGTMTVTDSNGDTITATLTGNFSQDTAISTTSFSYSGSMTNIVLSDNGSIDGFSGASSGTWNMGTGNFGLPLTGNVVHLSGIAANFFTSAFSFASGGGMTANISAPAIIPLPSAAWAGIGTLGALAGIGAIRRRRHTLA